MAWSNYRSDLLDYAVSAEYTVVAKSRSNSKLVAVSERKTKVFCTHEKVVYVTSWSTRSTYLATLKWLLMKVRSQHLLRNTL